MILRESDAGAWTADPGGTLEQRRYYCQNWRSDTSVVLTDTGKMVESVKYSSYGVPFAMPAGDTDSDGDWDATDDGVIAADVPNTDARRDTDLDGDVDAADITQANGAKSGYYATGRGILSGVNNRKGYAGYESASEFESSTGRHLSHVRNRVYDADLGRWTRRDPLGYVDGMGMYAYGAFIAAAPTTSRCPPGWTYDPIRRQCVMVSPPPPPTLPSPTPPLEPTACWASKLSLDPVTQDCTLPYKKVCDETPTSGPPEYYCYCMTCIGDGCRIKACKIWILEPFEFEIAHICEPGTRMTGECSTPSTHPRWGRGTQRPMSRR